MKLLQITILIRPNEMQQYEDVYLLQNYSTCFGCLSHPSSGVHQTVTAASCTGHSVRATTFRQRGHAGGRLLQHSEKQHGITRQCYLQLNTTDKDYQNIDKITT